MNQFAALISSFTIVVLMFPVFIKYMHTMRLIDKPGRRKVHITAKPSFGGFPIFIGFLCSSLIWVNLSEWWSIKFILLSQLAVIIFGLRDDLFPLRPVYKLFGQILAASLIIFLLNLRITGFYGFLGIYEIPVALSYLITFIALIGITNSFNLIDGLDGLAGSIASVAFLTFGIWFYLVGDYIYSTLSFSLLGSLLAFLVFNWQPSRIFMGDTGSLFIGLTIAMFTIRFMDVNYGLPDVSAFKFQSTIGMAACVIIIPLVDTMRIIILRLLKGHSPFRPDKSHIHHAIMRLGLDHSKATMILIAAQLLFILLATTFSQLSDLYIVPSVLILSTILCIVLDRLINNRVLR